MALLQIIRCLVTCTIVQDSITAGYAVVPALGEQEEQLSDFES